MKQLNTVLSTLSTLRDNGVGGVLMIRCQNSSTLVAAQKSLCEQSEWNWHLVSDSDLGPDLDLAALASGKCSAPNDVCLVTQIPSDHAVSGKPQFYSKLDQSHSAFAASGGPLVVMLITIQNMRALNNKASNLFRSKKAFVAWPVEASDDGPGPGISAGAQRSAARGQSSPRPPSEAEKLRDDMNKAMRPGSHSEVSEDDAQRIVNLMEARANEMEESSDKAHTILRVALIQSAQGMLEEARMSGTRAARLFKKLNDMQGMAQCYEVMGSLAERRGNVKMAMEWMRHACEAWRTCGNDTRVAETNAKLGHLCYVSADHENAAKHLQEAIAIDEALGNEAKVAAGLRRLGMLALGQDKAQVAEKLFRDAMEICKKLGDDVGLSRCAHQLGHLFEEVGDPAEALRWHQQSLEVKKKLGDRLGMATSYHHLGNTYYKLRQHDDALTNYTHALEFEEREGDKQGQANTLLQMGEVAFEQKRFEDAIFYFASARYIYRTLEAALEGILTNRIRRLEDFLDPSQVRAIERDAERRMQRGISTEADSGALDNALEDAAEALDQPLDAEVNEEPEAE